MQPGQFGFGLSQERFRLAKIEGRSDSGIKPPLGDAQPLPPTAHRRFGQCDPFVSFPRGEVGRGHVADKGEARSEEHTSELQSLMRISYAVFCLKKKTTN